MFAQMMQLKRENERLNNIIALLQKKQSVSGQAWAKSRARASDVPGVMYNGGGRRPSGGFPGVGRSQ
jgi:hypothetical protein